MGLLYEDDLDSAYESGLSCGECGATPDDSLLSAEERVEYWRGYYLGRSDYEFDNSSRNC